MHDVHVQSVALSLMVPPGLMRCSSQSYPTASHETVARMSVGVQPLVPSDLTITYGPAAFVHTSFWVWAPQNRGIVTE